MRTNWDIDKIKQEALKYSTRVDFKRGNYRAYTAAQKRGAIEEVCVHMARPKNEAYTEEELRIKAKKYLTRNKFQKSDSGAYTVAWKKGKEFLDSICSHMPKRASIGEKHPGYKWTYEILLQEALKYRTRSEFKATSESAYSIAHGRKILDQICLHMIPSRGSSLGERELFELIKKQYPEVKRLRKTKIKIINKEQIYGFEIDIFIPSLNKGIEFDGTYYHSFEGLKRSRSHWPDDDIRNYHQIKDDYFNSVGIIVLHIVELEWTLNKENCIKRCFEFLKDESGN